MPAPNALKYATQLLLNTCLSQQLQAAVNTKKGAMKKERGNLQWALAAVIVKRKTKHIFTQLCCLKIVKSKEKLELSATGDAREI